MNSSIKVAWTQFEGDDQVAQFLDAAVTLHRPIFDRLAEQERPFFHDYWLRTFNDTDSFLGTIDGVPHALVTQPIQSGIHQYRWSTSSLACSNDVFGQLQLPDGVRSNQAFMLSSCRTGSALPNTMAVETQLGYARSLHDLVSEYIENEKWMIDELRANDLDETLALMDRGYSIGDGSGSSLSEQQTELVQILKNDAGWCWIARSSDDSKICGVVSYIANHIPLAGVPAVLVSDLVVDPMVRGQGLAGHLQRHAYEKLHEQGLRLVFGNVEPQNKASRRQAEILERTIWYRAVVFEGIDCNDN